MTESGHNEAPLAIPTLLQTIKEHREIAVDLLGEELMEQGYREKNRRLLEALPKDYPRLKADNQELSELSTAMKYQQEQALAALGPLAGAEIRQEMVHPILREGTGFSDEIFLLDTSSYPPQEKLFWDATKVAVRNAQSDIAASDFKREIEELDNRQLRRAYRKQERAPGGHARS